MSDPFDRLRGTDGGPPPDVDAIRARARHIERRRYVALGGGAAAIVLLAISGIVLSTGPVDEASRDLAQPFSVTASPEPQTTTSAIEGGTAARRVPGPQAALSEGSAPQPAEESGSTAGAATAADSRAAGAESAPSGFQVTLQVDDSVPRGAGFTLRACNRGDERAELTFPSGQRYDFEVSRDGELVWRWSDGRAFTQVYGQEQWAAGECKTYNERWDGRNSEGAPAPPGSYRAVGILTSSPPIRSAPQTFCLDAC